MASPAQRGCDHDTRPKSDRYDEANKRQSVRPGIRKEQFRMRRLANMPSGSRFGAPTVAGTERIQNLEVIALPLLDQFPPRDRRLALHGTKFPGQHLRCETDHRELRDDVPVT